MIAPSEICALVLCGGRGSRMKGADKGLVPFRGRPLVQVALERLAAQTLPPAHFAISANRNLERYCALGQAYKAQVWSDGSWGPSPGTGGADGVQGRPLVVTDGDPINPNNIATDISPHNRPHAIAQYAGPLAGILTALKRSSAPYLLTVPCDAPLLPLTLCELLARALETRPHASLAVANAISGWGGNYRTQPTFSLLRRDPQGTLVSDLEDFLASGGRKIDQWQTTLERVVRTFGPLDGGCAGPMPSFANANSLQELATLMLLAS